MLTVSDIAPNQTCAGLSRRNFLQAGVLGSLALPDLLKSCNSCPRLICLERHCYLTRSFVRSSGWLLVLLLWAPLRIGIMYLPSERICQILINFYIIL